MKKIQLLLIVAMITTLYAFSLIKNEKSNGKKGYKIGDIATDFKLKNVDGNMVSLTDFTQAKGFIIIFTCNTCPVSVAYEDRIIALDKKYKNAGFPVIAINPNDPEVQQGDSFKLMQKRAKEKGFTYPYLLDEGQHIYPLYGATRTPHVFLLQKEKEGLIVKYIGAIDDSSRNPSSVKTTYVENAVDALLSDLPIEITSSKAIGCGIKAKR